MSGLTADNYLDLLRINISSTIKRIDKAVEWVENNPGNVHGEIYLCRETLAARELLKTIEGLIWKEQSYRACEKVQEIYSKKGKSDE